MPCKISYFSLNQPLASRYIRRINILPASEVLHRGFNMLLKRLHGGLLSFPQNIHIEVTNHCNLNCPMCVFSNQIRPKGFMEFGLFKEIVQQCRNKRPLEKLALMGLGEPFLHPQLIEMSAFAKLNKIRHIFTSTNAALLDEKLANRLILHSGFDEIAISLDGATKSTYESIRRGADFKQVQENILNFISLRENLKRKNPRVVLQFLIMKQNFQEQDAFVQFWRDKLDKQDTILLRDVDTFGGQVTDYRLSQQIPRIKRRPCLQLWRDLIISWCGDVSVCCKDVNYLLKVGNIRDAALKEIWLNSQWSSLRNLHKEGRWSEIELCARCSEWG